MEKRQKNRIVLSCRYSDTRFRRKKTGSSQCRKKLRNIISNVNILWDNAFCTKNALKRLEKIYDLADVYHCDNIDQVSEDFIAEAHIPTGTFDNVKECKYSIPSHWDIGKVYKRLIKQVAASEKIEIVDALIKVYSSFISEKIDD